MKIKMHCHRIFQAFKFSKSALPVVCMKSGLCPVVANDQFWHICCLHTHGMRMKNALTVSGQPEVGYLKRIVKRYGWLDHPRWRLKTSAYILYESVADKVPYMKFFEEFQMPDTFNSWFLVTELHVWMLMVRTMAEGAEGRFVRNNIVEAMWEDVITRVKKLEPGSPSAHKTQILELLHQFQAAMVGYDEGLLSDDMVLAGAVWRTLLQQDCSDPENVERIVHYIRKQVKLLDEMVRDEILLSPSIMWIELPQKFGSKHSEEKTL